MLLRPRRLRYGNDLVLGRPSIAVLKRNVAFVWASPTGGYVAGDKNSESFHRNSLFGGLLTNHLKSTVF